MRISKQNYYLYLKLLNSSNSIELFPDNFNDYFGKYFYNFINGKVYNLCIRYGYGRIEYFVRVYKRSV